MIGFDDHELAFAVGLTTVAQDPADLGAKGAQLLVDRLTGHIGPPREVHSAVRLEVRTSTSHI
jgi:LacI family transcriptional regulator